MQHDNAGHRERLRRRFSKSGLSGLGEHEVIEFLLMLCIPRGDVKPQARALLRRFGSLHGILDAEEEKLLELEGIGASTAAALAFIKAILTQYLYEEAAQKPMFDGVSKLFDLWKVRIGGLAYEVFEVAYLDASHQLLDDGVKRLSTGIANRTQIYPPRVAAEALKRNAVHIALAHNHPSGDLKASDEDIALTKAIQQSCEAVGIKILDHVIVSSKSTFSFLRNELL